MMFLTKCQICHKNVEYRRKGFPKKWCDECKPKGLKKYHAEWHQKNKLRRKINRKRVPAKKKTFICKNCDLKFLSYRPNAKWCIGCRRIAHAEGVKRWRQKNPIKYRQIVKIWMLNNKRRVKEYSKNRDTKRERSRGKLLLEAMMLISDVRKEIISLGE